VGQQFLDRAVSTFAAAAKADPSLTLAEVNEGIALMYLQKLPEAERLLEAAAIADPKDPHIWYALGLLYRNENHPEKSLEAFQKVAALRPGDPDTHYMIASVDFDRTSAMRSCFWMPCSTNRVASDAACANNSRKEVTRSFPVRSCSMTAGASGVAAAVLRSQSESRSPSASPLPGSGRSRSGKRHPPGKADPCGSEQQQLSGTNSAGAPQVHIIDDQIAGKGVTILCHGG